MKIKKALCVGAASLLALSMVFGMAACDSDSSGSSGSESGSGSGSSGGSTTTGGTITVWCPEAAVELTTSQLATFKSENTDCPYTFTVTAVGEGEATTSLLTDVTAGADIYFFAQDQLARLVQADALSPVSSTYVERVTERNDSGSVAAGTVSSTLYAYPLTSDNGFFMYYDKSVLSEDDIKDQTTIIEKCKEAGKQIGFQLTNSGWYNAAYFFATGCSTDFTTDDNGEFIGYSDTYNSAKGIIALKGMAELMASEAFVGSDSAAASLFNSGAAVVVSGTWDYDTAYEALGDNLGCAELWSFTVDGESYHLGSFSGNKLLGIKPQTDSTRAAWCQAVGNYLTDETCQKARFTSLSWGPSNTNAQAMDEVQANPGLAALAAQSEYATPQGQSPNAWWDATKAIAVSVQALGGSPSDSALQSVLDTYTAALNDMTAVITELAVAGNFADSNWNASPTIGTYIFNYDNNTYANKSENSPLVGIWTTTVTCDAECGFRVCDKNWKTYGGYSHLTEDSYSGLTEGNDDNIVVDVAGTYKITFDTTGTTNTIKVELVSAS